MPQASATTPRALDVPVPAVATGDLLDLPMGMWLVDRLWCDRGGRRRAVLHLSLFACATARRQGTYCRPECGPYETLKAKRTWYHASDLVAPCLLLIDAVYPKCRGRRHAVAWPVGLCRQWRMTRTAIVYVVELLFRVTLAEAERVTGFPGRTLAGIFYWMRVLVRELHQPAAARYLAVDVGEIRGRGRLLVAGRDSPGGPWRLIDILHQVDEDTLGRWLERFDGLDGVEAIALDMAGNLRAHLSSWLPWAVLVSDKPHLLRLFVAGLHRIRNRHLRQLKRSFTRFHPEGAMHERLKGLLESHWDDLKHDIEGQAFVERAFRKVPELRTAYFLKEELFGIFANPGADPAAARQRLDDWANRVPLEVWEFFGAFVGAVCIDWADEVGAIFDHPFLTTTFVEVTVRAVKDLQRATRGGAPWGHIYARAIGGAVLAPAQRRAIADEICRLPRPSTTRLSTEFLA